MSIVKHQFIAPIGKKLASPSAEPYLFFVSSPTTTTKITEPMMDQITGKLLPPIVTSSSSGKFILSLIHDPSSAPMNPTTIETMHPPLLYPAIDWPIEPQIPAIKSSSRNSKKPILYIFYF